MFGIKKLSRLKKFPRLGHDVVAHPDIMRKKRRKKKKKRKNNNNNINNNNNTNRMNFLVFL